MRTKVTQTLLNSWLRIYEDEDNGYAEFLDTLFRRRTVPSQAMLDGIRFEGVVNAVLNGEEIYQDHEWFGVINQLYPILEGAQQQVCLFKEVEVGGEKYLLNGVLDYLKAGVIYDTKFSKRYYLNKYIKSTQHSMYLSLVPEAYEFQYLSCDGKDIYKEIYRPDECVPIELQIAQFRRFLKIRDLEWAYLDNWEI